MKNNEMTWMIEKKGQMNAIDTRNERRVNNGIVVNRGEEDEEQRKMRERGREKRTRIIKKMDR